MPALIALFACAIVALIVSVCEIARRIDILRREHLGLDDRIPIWWDGEWK